MKIELSIVFLCLLVSFIDLKAQSEITYPDLDKSPLDVVYYPTKAVFRNFQKGEGRTSLPKARIIYSRPQKKGRTLFGGLVPDGEIWRVGANEATELTLYQDVRMGEQLVPAGTYSLFVNPKGKEWTLILSTELYVWGAYNLDESAFKFQIPLQIDTEDNQLEALTILFSEENDNVQLVIGWDQVRAKLPVDFSLTNP